MDEEGFVYLTGRKKNLIITKNGENVSPEELENKIGEYRLVQEILVREKEGVIEAEIYPDYEYAKKKDIADIRAALQQLIDEYNQGAPYGRPNLKRILPEKSNDIKRKPRESEGRSHRNRRASPFCCMLFLRYGNYAQKKTDFYTISEYNCAKHKIYKG